MFSHQHHFVFKDNHVLNKWPNCVHSLSDPDPGQLDLVGSALPHSSSSELWYLGGSFQPKPFYDSKLLDEVETSPTCPYPLSLQVTSGRQIPFDRTPLTLNYTSFHYVPLPCRFSGDHKALFEYLNIKHVIMLVGEQSHASIPLTGNLAKSSGTGICTVGRDQTSLNLNLGFRWGFC